MHRLQIVFDVAHEFGRKVCVLGRSMLKNIEIAEGLGLLKIPHGTMIGLGESRALNANEIVYLVTGSQGESRAALWNLATNTYKGMEIEKGDTVILSARIIPGNDKRISRLIGHLYKRGANIIEEKRRLIHVSGHASQEDIRIMTETVRPKYRRADSRRIPDAFPSQGIHQKSHRRLFERQYYSDRKRRCCSNLTNSAHESSKITISAEHSLTKNRSTKSNTTFSANAKNSPTAARSRLVVTIDKETKKLAEEPQITFQGVAGMDLTNGVLGNARQSITEAVGAMSQQEISNKSFFKENLRIHLKRFLQTETGTKPVIVTTIVEV